MPERKIDRTGGSESQEKRTVKKFSPLTAGSNRDYAIEAENGARAYISPITFDHKTRNAIENLRNSNQNQNVSGK